jgi:hypothetical protein
VLLVECCLGMGQASQCQAFLDQVGSHYSRRDSAFLYVLGLL